MENACEHGVPESNSLTVAITFRRDGDRLSITVEDNGAGMSPEALAEIRRMLETSGDGNRIGLRNIYARMRITKGESSAMTIDSAPGEGTKVRLSWPL